MKFRGGGRRGDLVSAPRRNNLFKALGDREGAIASTRRACAPRILSSRAEARFYI
jgi:hypothetical protein